MVEAEYLLEQSHFLFLAIYLLLLLVTVRTKNWTMLVVMMAIPIGLALWLLLSCILEIATPETWLPRIFPMVLGLLFAVAVSIWMGRQE